ncbi:GLUT4 regulating protein TUG-domain-containing protein [Lasiosphaeris hirsuta]|uniref:GLUT4 regulating protein TUG-domain-containing protein n=1 Tax=Lasiosphaeris hirsuta TaxID=260670 RepID=A0AA40BBA0_9PEZI|nr:GLUT4 regulating protein TUG-domain-containing protein [Lasiosphaeris hirsuta]
MASHVEVVSTDLRRIKVKVTPSTYLVDVLGEACQKLHASPDRFLLKHKQKVVDLTGPFRTSGLSPGAKLELVLKSSSPSVVSIALDVEGSRFTKKLPSDMPLWQVLRQFETSEQGLNVTGKGLPKSDSGGQLYYQAPVVNIMGREYSAKEDLQKTLSQCGINSGSMVLRIFFHRTEKTLSDALQEMDLYMNEVDPEKPREQAKAETQVTPTVSETKEEIVSGDTPMPDFTASETVEKGNDTAVTSDKPTNAPADSDALSVGEPSTSIANVDHLQPTGVFSAPEYSTPVAAQIYEDDSVYEPTIAHAQLRQQQLLTRTQNTRLKSDAELAAIEAEKVAKLAKITKVDVKVRFPDQTSAQWTINPEDTGSFLYQAIRGVMAHPQEPFKLVMSGPNGGPIFDNAKPIIASYGLKTRELLNLLWEDAVSQNARSAPFLNDKAASRALAVPVPTVPQGSADEGESTAGPSTTVATSEKKERSLDSAAVRKTISKLFKLPGRK